MAKQSSAWSDVVGVCGSSFGCDSEELGTVVFWICCILNIEGCLYFDIRYLLDGGRASFTRS
jgi:hypothetical protein